MKEYDSLSDNEKRNMLASVANLYYNVDSLRYYMIAYGPENKSGS